MCGIGGIVRFAGTAPVEEQRLGLLLGALRHRGPDDEGVYRAPDGCAGLVHARLSILDLSAAGHQPMGMRLPGAAGSGGSRMWIVFNGEIYNFRQLRAELERDGEMFDSHTDTEVILRLYAREGAACVRKLSGMFAFAIWNEVDQSLFLARDFFGIKPLYFRDDGGEFIFSSEVRGILATQRAPRQLNPQGVYSYLRTGSVSEPETLALGVRAFPPGHHAMVTARGIEMQAYREMSFGAEEMSAEAAREQTARALRESVSRHFVSDVPVGVLLSGGIDSNGVLGLAAEAGHRGLSTFSIGFKQKDNDESALARRSARHFGAAHNLLMLDGASARAHLGEFFSSVDQPSIDGLNTWFACRLAASHGIKVVLSGLGGDEFFGGYPSFFRVPRMMQWLSALGGPQSRPTRFAAGLAGMLPDARARRLSEFFGHNPTIAGAFGVIRSVFLASEASAITSSMVPDRPAALADYAGEDVPSSWAVPDQVCYLEVRRYMLNQLLRDSDTMSMASGVELRVPLVDERLFSEVSDIPWTLRLAPGKKLLRESFGVLPEYLWNRPKRGFVFPYREWFSSEWKEFVSPDEDVADYCRGNWYRLWAIIVLREWTRRWIN
ncbi:MAG: asparagine synthase (glutamine-hydrolyzing) [Chthoniobacterales bacterium]